MNSAISLRIRFDVKKILQSIHPTSSLFKSLLPQLRGKCPVLPASQGQVDLRLAYRILCASPVILLTQSFKTLCDSETWPWILEQLERIERLERFEPFERHYDFERLEPLERLELS